MELMIGIAVGIVASMLFFVMSRGSQRRLVPKTALAHEIRGAPRPLPNKDHGEVATLQALVWMEGVADIAAFTLLELGYVATKAEAVEAGQRAACAWHGVEPSSVPWRDRPNTK